MHRAVVVEGGQPQADHYIALLHGAGHPVHALSPWADGRFVAGNRAASPRDLMESEIFGRLNGKPAGRQWRAAARHRQAAAGAWQRQ